MHRSWSGTSSTPQETPLDAGVVVPALNLSQGIWEKASRENCEGAPHMGVRGECLGAALQESPWHSGTPALI
eukprot:113341-Amphidinium_carterae.1